MDVLETAQRKAVKLMKGLGCLAYKERLRARIV